MPHATVPSPGLQALILCGPGSSLSTFTSNPTDFPKAIVPIANRPMVWYPLEWCYRMGVSNITLITPPESKAALESSLATNPALTSLPSPKPEVLAPADLTQTTATGELLQLPEVQKCLASDFIVLPCDLISELDGTHLLQQWMTLNPLSQSRKADSKRGGLAVFYPTYGLETISTKKDETDFLATVSLPPPVVPPLTGSLRPNIEELVLNMPTDTLNDKITEGPSKGFYRLRHSLLTKFGRVGMRTKHRDAHIYVFPLWVKDFVKQNDRFESISEDVLGWWAKSAWQEGLAEKLGLDVVLRNNNQKSRSTSSGADSDGGSPEPNRMTQEDGAEADAEPDVDWRTMSSTNSTRHRAPATQTASRVGVSIPLPEKSITIPQLLAYVQPAPSSPLIRRVDTSAQLRSISLYLAKQAPDHPLSPESKIHSTAQLEQQSRVSQEDCLVAENVKIGSRTNIKESVIGANCEIGRNVRMTKCLLMDGCVVGDGVQLTECILGRRAKVLGMKASDVPPTPTSQIESSTQPAKRGKKKGAADDDEEDRTKLTDCEVAPGFVVEAGTEAKGEKFMGFDTDGLEEDEEDEDMAMTETGHKSFTA